MSFGTVITFLFTFFVLGFTFTAVFLAYQSQISENSDLLSSFEDKSNVLNKDFTISNPFYLSGRLNFLIKNSDNAVLDFYNRNVLCFDLIENNLYVKNKNLFFNVLNHIPNNYEFIDKSSTGIFTSKIGFDNSIDNIYKIISCDGENKYISISANKENWWDSNWAQRKRITVNNNAGINLAEYQIELDLNNSNFDFSLGKENEIRFLYPLKESLSLDLTFDTYSQSLIDYSSFSNSVYLGTTNGVEITDPTNNDGVIFNGINFDGVDDKITIMQNNSLYLNNSLTYSAWVKWSGSGNTFANIFTNGGTQNSLQIVNDGGVNDNKILFKLLISGTQKSLYSNITMDNSPHFLTATYDGTQMKIYQDSILVGNLTSIGNVDVQVADNYIGTQGASFYFNGSIDEVKIFSTDLKQSEIEDLYYNNLKFRELDYYFTEFEGVSETAKVFIKVPSIIANSNVTFDIYYDNRNSISTNSNIKNTFNYTAPRTVGYVLSDKISTTTGLNIMSLYDSNIIKVGTNSFSQNEQVGATLSAASINLNDEVKMKYLAQVDGQANGDDIITPISWAGTQFYYRGFRNVGTADRFCMISPWGSASVEIRNASILGWSGTITPAGQCVSLDIATANNLAINSSIPILVSYYGTSNQDAFVLYPATNEDLYGLPSASGFSATGPNGVSFDVYRSFGTLLQSYTLGAYGTNSFSGGGTAGTVAAHKLVSTDGGFFGAIQQGDGDGSESSTFAPLKEMGVKFGSNEGVEYLVFASKYSNANCTSYTSTGVLVDNIPTGTGSNGIYNYSFDVGNSVTYLNSGWKLECDKPVWGYFEEDAQGDETNLFSHPMMRQYVYPSPTILIN